MNRKVKGTLFLDYVRMVKSCKHVDWSKHLTDEDLAIIDEKVDPEKWYPLETFERMGLGVLQEIAGDDVNAVYTWGKDYMVDLFRVHEGLVAEGDPMQSLMRFKVLQRSFFNFDGIEVLSLTVDHAVLKIFYHMSQRAEEASSYQTLGFFERLLDRAGAREIRHTFLEKGWETGGATVLEFRWK